MMDLGSTVCTPTKPGCMLCPLEPHCYARREGATHLLPVKAAKLKRCERWFHFLLITDTAGRIAIRRRPTDGFWGGLYEIPNEEVESGDWKKRPGSRPTATLKHVFTHFDMHIAAYHVAVGEIPEAEDWQWIEKTAIDDFAFSKAVLKIFRKLF
jgi:A/G-specific adenine glycosylase